jgi:hypothetical protein
MNIIPAAITGAGIGLVMKFLSGGSPGALSPLKRPDVKFNGKQEYRAKLVVPPSYLENDYSQVSPLQNFGGILFPYTPQISYDMTANYSTANLQHSNFAINSYKNSTIGNFSVSAKFTVQNDSDALFYLATMHMLRALTKMKYGSDTDAGSPPPVCRFSAFGDYMIKDVPVVVSTFRTELPTEIDYYMIDESLNSYSVAYSLFGTNFIPTVSSISLTLIPMFSREEQNKFSVDDYINSRKLKTSGFL